MHSTFSHSMTNYKMVYFLYIPTFGGILPVLALSSAEKLAYFRLDFLSGPVPTSIVASTAVLTDFFHNVAR